MASTKRIKKKKNPLSKYVFFNFIFHKSIIVLNKIQKPHKNKVFRVIFLIV